MSFPDIGYTIYHVKQNGNGRSAYIDLQAPEALSKYDTNMENLVWQDGRYLGINNYKLTSSCWNQVHG